MARRPRQSKKSLVVVVSALLGASQLCLSEQSFAQAPNADPAAAREDERRALYAQGVALADVGHWDEALTKFEAVVALRSAPAALMALGTAQEKTGRLLRAKGTYQQAFNDARSAGDQEYAGKANEALAALTSRLPRIFVHLPQGASGAQIVLDGAVIEPSDEGTGVDPGAHHLVVKAPHKPTFEERIEVARYDHRDVIVRFASPTPTIATESSASQDEKPSGRKLPILPLVVGGTGLAVAVLGVVLRVQAQGDYDSASADCHSALCPSSDSIATGNAARTRMLAATVVAGVGVAAVAGAAVWWAVTPTSKGERSDANASLAVGAAILPQVAWLSARGRF